MLQLLKDLYGQGRVTELALWLFVHQHTDGLVVRYYCRPAPNLETLTRVSQ